MPKGSSPTSQEVLADKLEVIRSLVSDCLSLIAKPERRRNQRSPAIMKDKELLPSLRFDSNARAFVKSHAKGLSGPKKFVLILAYLAKGDIHKEVSLGNIQKLWNSMTSSSLLGMEFNLSFSIRAKENGWVDSKKRGIYTLDDSWKTIFNND
jgi:hypothetical protein